MSDWVSAGATYLPPFKGLREVRGAGEFAPEVLSLTLSVNGNW